MYNDDYKNLEKITHRFFICFSLSLLFFSIGLYFLTIDKCIINEKTCKYLGGNCDDFYVYNDDNHNDDNDNDDDNHDDIYTPISYIIDTCTKNITYNFIYTKYKKDEYAEIEIVDGGIMFYVEEPWWIKLMIVISTLLFVCSKYISKKIIVLTKRCNN